MFQGLEKGFTGNKQVNISLFALSVLVIYFFSVLIMEAKYIVNFDY